MALPANVRLLHGARGAAPPGSTHDVELVGGLRRGEAWARTALYDRYAPLVERLLRRIMGVELHADPADVLHDVFVQAFASIHTLRSSEALVAWIQTIAVHTAHRTIRSRQRRRWLRFFATELIPEVPVDGLDPGVIEAHRRTYATLDRMPPGERVAFALRHIEGMDAAEIAQSSNVSLSTMKRRLAQAERRFVLLASRDDVLRTWLEGGGKWT